MTSGRFINKWTLIIILLVLVIAAGITVWIGGENIEVAGVIEPKVTRVTQTTPAC